MQTKQCLLTSVGSISLPGNSEKQLEPVIRVSVLQYHISYSSSFWATSVLQQHPQGSWERMVLQNTSRVYTKWRCSIMFTQLHTLSATPSFSMGGQHSTPARTWLFAHVTQHSKSHGWGAALHCHGKRKHHMMGRDWHEPCHSGYVSLCHPVIMTHHHFLANILVLWDSKYVIMDIVLARWKHVTDSPT